MRRYSETSAEVISALERVRSLRTIPLRETTLSGTNIAGGKTFLSV